MLEEMSWSQLVMWHAYYASDPFGEQRADARAALIASILANVNRDPKKHPRPYELKDFMLYGSVDGTTRRAPAGPRAPVTDQEQWAGIKRMARVLAGGKN